MPFVIPVFIPHEGCPHDCVFCNQHRISGQEGELITGQEVAAIIDEWLGYRRSSVTGSTQVAFYGGSFTGLPSARQEDLLGAVAPYLNQGAVQSIRLSTRPDYIDEERLDLLVRHRVSVVELGVQSMDDGVLQQAGRGHSSGDVVAAVACVKEHELEVGLQLMVGLPGERAASLRHTASAVIQLNPGFVRIYPVLVVSGSILESWWREGRYAPLSLERAVLLSAYFKKRFDAVGIPVIRMGLQPGEALERSLLAGPYHPAFGELVLSRLMLQQTRRLLRDVDGGGRVPLVISDKDVSVFRGVKSANISRLNQLGLGDAFTLRLDSQQPRHTLRREG